MNLLEALQNRQIALRRLDAPNHGGRLQQAIANANFAADEWLDLSTGINPEPWPFTLADTSVWQRLPENQQALTAAAHRYYLANAEAHTNTALVAIPGSQWFIQHFPGMAAQATQGNTRPLSVLVPDLGFSEHNFWWHYHGHQVETYCEATLPALLDCPLQADVMVVINPNNPSTQLMQPDQLRQAASQNPETLFIVDEAFIDTRPTQSLLCQAVPANIVVLRSIGKFFGLAGLRVGFCIANHTLIECLSTELGPWPLATASEQIAIQALQDTTWQSHGVARIQQLSRELLADVQSAFTHCAVQPQLLSSDLFISLRFASAPRAQQFHEALKKQAVLTRLFESQGLVRIGLVPGHKRATFNQRLQQALTI